jgi:hypothetical protein
VVVTVDGEIGSLPDRFHARVALGQIGVPPPAALREPSEPAPIDRKFVYWRKRLPQSDNGLTS